MNQKKSNKPENSQKPIAGRQRLSWPVIEGIGALSSMLGVPESFVKKVKRDGSKAFLTHNRIDTGILIPELFAAMSKGASELPDGFASWKELLESEKAKREQIKRQSDEGALMATAEAQRQAAQAMQICFSDMERISRELPPAIAGLGAVEIHKRLNSEIETLRKNLTKKFEEIGK